MRADLNTATSVLSNDQNKQKWKKVLAIVCAVLACLTLFVAIFFPVLFKAKEFSATISGCKVETYQVSIYTNEYNATLSISTLDDFDMSKLDLLQEGKRITFDVAILSDISNAQGEIPIFSLYCDGECIFDDGINEDMQMVSGKLWGSAVPFVLASVLLFLSYKQKWIFSKRN